MKPGPRKTPTKLHVLRGETRPSRLNLHEPKLEELEPEPPEALSAPARRVWDRTVAALRGAKVLTRADGDALAVYCEHVVSHEQMVTALRATGAGGYLIRGARNGDLVKNPLVAMIRNEAALIRGLAAEFGLTPSARTGLVTPSESPESLEELLS